MSDATDTPILTRLALRDGTWNGHLSRPGNGGDRPEIRASLQGRVLDGVRVEPDGAGWTLAIPLPANAVCDGAQVLQVVDAATGQLIGERIVAAGPAESDDLRAEVLLLRAEIDLLKRAFRSHCRGDDDVPRD